MQNNEIWKFGSGLRTNALNIKWYVPATGAVNIPEILFMAPPMLMCSVWYGTNLSKKYIYLIN